MSPPALVLRRFVEQLLANAPNGDPPAESVCSTVVEQLGNSLGTLIGPLGLQALLHRALVRARPGCAWLSALSVDAEGRLQGLPEATAGLTAWEIATGFRLLLGEVFGLLVTLIGEDLTLRVLAQIWPGLSATPSDSDEKQE